MAMASTVGAGGEEGAMAKGEAALERLRSADPALYLSPSPDLSALARAASSHLFSSLVPLCPNPPVDRLLAGEGFDAEQVWFQVDLLSRPLLARLRRELRRFERDPPSFAPPESVGGGEAGKDAEEAAEEEEGVGDDRFDGEDDEEEEEREEGDGDDDDEDEGEEDDDDDKEEEEDEEEGGKRVGVVEDRFLKIKELEEYLEKGDAEEYDEQELGSRNRDKKKRKANEEDEDEDEDEDGSEEEEDDGDDLDLEDFDDDAGEEADDAENIRYEDFYGGKAKKGHDEKDGGKKKSSSKKVQFLDDSRDMEMDAEEDDRDEKETKVLSTHEKELQKMRMKIEQMEKANLEPKSWIMQGEVTAAKRPKNSALEVDLDFEHRTRPAPVITEEVTASLEEMIKKRIIENLFDDAQRAPVLPYKAPKEHKELDENKSKKGLAEIYEEEYAQKTGLASAPLSVSDDQKREASALFKKICLKLDALSHFHFAPKPVIEDMSIQANVPALAMEEIAPIAVSDAAMLAPEEIFEGKGDIKAEGELNQAERRRRRANKKRKFKAKSAKRSAKKPRESAALNHTSGN